MISIEQIKILDEKVKKAINVISDLKAENATLMNKLDEYQTRIEELERLIEDFKQDQSAIEQGILDAINQLDYLEQNDSAPALEQPHPAAEQPETTEPPDDTTEPDTESLDSAGEDSVSTDESAADSEEYSQESSTSPANDQESTESDENMSSTQESSELDIF